MHKIRTLRDARRPKEYANAAAYARDVAAAAEKYRVAEVLRNNPEIGVLCRKGKAVYYATTNVSTYIETTNVDALAAALAEARR